MRIKKIFKETTVLCALLACFSCQKEETLIGLTGKPDKVIENVSGRLSYLKELEIWVVTYYIPETIDSAESYLIVKMPDRKFPFEESKQVLVSGSCYKIPRQRLADKGIFYPAGEEYYYIKVTKLN